MWNCKELYDPNDQAFESFAGGKREETIFRILKNERTATKKKMQRNVTEKIQQKKAQKLQNREVTVIRIHSRNDSVKEHRR